MGDRISIQFVNGNQKSVVLFSHWDGKELLRDVAVFFKTLLPIVEKAPTTPASRLEVNTLMVDFIRYLTKDAEHITGNYYLGATENDGDNSDNGHFELNVVAQYQEAKLLVEELKTKLENHLVGVIIQGQYNQINDYKKEIVKNLIEKL